MDSKDPFAELVVTNINEEPIELPSVWNQHTTILIFVRHFLWGQCQEYFLDVLHAFEASNGKGSGVQLCFVGCGKPHMARSFAETYNFTVSTPSRPTPYHLYVTSPDVYQQLGMPHGADTTVTCSRFCLGTLRALYQGFTRCWCICSSGDFQQQGGAFVIQPGSRVVFQHIEKRPDDHADTRELFEAAGIKLADSNRPRSGCCFDWCTGAASSPFSASTVFLDSNEGSTLKTFFPVASSAGQCVTWIV